MRGFCRPYVLLHPTLYIVLPLGCLPTRAFVSWLLEVRGWLLFPDSLTLCPQYWFHTWGPYYDISGFIRYRGLVPGLGSIIDFDGCFGGWTVYLTLKNRRENICSHLYS